MIKTTFRLEIKINRKNVFENVRISKSKQKFFGTNKYSKCCNSLSPGVCVVGHQRGDRARSSRHGSGHADGITERYTSRHVVQVKT